VETLDCLDTLISLGIGLLAKISASIASMSVRCNKRIITFDIPLVSEEQIHVGTLHR
jgi:hypothetical protein